METNTRKLNNYLSFTFSIKICEIYWLISYNFTTAFVRKCNFLYKTKCQTSLRNRPIPDITIDIIYTNYKENCTRSC